MSALATGTGQTLQAKSVPEATLKVPVVGPWRRSPGRSFVAILSVRAPGDAPLTPALLVSSDGADHATVTATSQVACHKVSPLETGLPGSRNWCLRLVGLSPGNTVTGKLRTGSVVLTLTVAPRDPWAPWPGLTVLVGLSIAAGAVLVPAFFRRRAVKLQLWDELARKSKIIGLDRGWVELLVADGRISGIEAGFAATVIDVVEHGPQRLAADRRRLTLAVASCGLAPDGPFLIRAAELAMPEVSARREDFFSDDGALREQTPPQEWLTRISRAERILVTIGLLQKRLSEVANENRRERVQEELEKLVEQVANAGPEEDVADAALADVEDGLSKVSNHIREAVGQRAIELTPYLVPDELTGQPSLEKILRDIVREF